MTLEGSSALSPASVYTDIKMMEVADMAAFLASISAPHVTGQSISVDGNCRPIADRNSSEDQWAPQGRLVCADHRTHSHWRSEPAAGIVRPRRRERRGSLQKARKRACSGSE